MAILYVASVAYVGVRSSSTDLIGWSCDHRAMEKEHDGNSIGLGSVCTNIVRLFFSFFFRTCTLLANSSNHPECIVVSRSRGDDCQLWTVRPVSLDCLPQNQE